MNVYTGMTGNLGQIRRLLADDLRSLSSRENLPATLEEVITVAEQTEGVQLRFLITTLQPDTQAAADAFAEILATAANKASDLDTGASQHLASWQRVIAAAVAAVSGDTKAAAELGSLLDQLAQNQDWADLASVLRRILAGERGADLLDGLDEIEAEVAGQFLARLTQPSGTSQENL